jgi:hypothetical protein
MIKKVIEFLKTFDPKVFFEGFIYGTIALIVLKLLFCL